MALGIPIAYSLLLCGVALVMLSFGFLVVFSHRIAMSIQTQNVVARIVARVGSETMGASVPS